MNCVCLASWFGAPAIACPDVEHSHSAAVAQLAASMHFMAVHALLAPALATQSLSNPLAAQPQAQAQSACTQTCKQPLLEHDWDLILSQPNKRSPLRRGCLAACYAM